MKLKRILYWVLIGFFSVTFLVSGIYLVSYYVNSSQQEELYDNLAEIVDSNKNKDSTEPSSGGNAAAPTDPQGNIVKPGLDTDLSSILPEYREIYKLNQDLVGWINIPDTNINYPVLQSVEKDYYLYRNFYKEDNNHGAIYVREECNVFVPSDNVTIYGHHMKDESMFFDLDNYMKKSFWQDHQTFTFDTIYERHTYQVFAVFKTSGTAGEGYPFHVFVDAMSEDYFNQFVTDVKSMSLYDTGITAEYGDKLVCLCTCEYSKWNYRLVVVAKRIS